MAVTPFQSGVLRVIARSRKDGDETYVAGGRHHRARPPLASRAVNGGVYRSWMDGAGDFALKPRVLGRLPDIGCYERLKPGVTVIVK